MKKYRVRLGIEEQEKLKQTHARIVLFSYENQAEGPTQTV